MKPVLLVVLLRVSIKISCIETVYFGGFLPNLPMLALIQQLGSVKVNGRKMMKILKISLTHRKD
jgi:hypothetical protein